MAVIPGALSVETKKPITDAKNTEPARSLFVMPTNAKDGRDPFFPDSVRPFQSAVTNSSRPAIEISSLVVKGFYRDAKGVLVIINNRTFAVGDESDVTVPNGRIHVRCLEIRSNVVVIDANGEKHELHFGGE